MVGMDGQWTMNTKFHLINSVPIHSFLLSCHDHYIHKRNLTQVFILHIPQLNSWPQVIVIVKELDKVLLYQVFNASASSLFSTRICNPFFAHIDNLVHIGIARSRREKAVLPSLFGWHSLLCTVALSHFSSSVLLTSHSENSLGKVDANSAMSSPTAAATLFQPLVSISTRLSQS